MLKFTKINKGFVLLLALTLLLCGCGVDNTPIDGAATPTAAVSPTPTAPQTSPTPLAGGTLRIPMNQAPTSMHPLFLAQGEMRNVFSILFEPLLAFNEQREPVAALAERWNYNEAEGVWELSIRPGVLWHNNLGEVNAEDVKFTIDTILSNPTSCYYPMVSAYILSVEAVGVTTVKITPKINSIALLYALNIPIVPKSYYEGKQPNTMDIPYGSGPYTVESMQINTNTPSQISMTINDHWWKKRPSIDKIIAIGCKDNASAIDSFMKGDLDCVPTAILTTDIYATFEGVATKVYLSNYYDFLAPNLSRGIMSDLSVRKAIAYAINRRELLDNIFLNKAISSEQPIAPDSSLIDKTVLRYDYSTTDSKNLLTADGYSDTNGDGILEKNGVQLAFEMLVINTPEQPIRMETARAIAKQLKEVGFNVTVTALTADELQKRIDKKDYDMLLTGYYLSDAPNLRFAFTKGGAGNLSNYDGQGVLPSLALIDSAKSIDDLKTAAYQLQANLAKDLPQIGLFFEMNTLIQTKNIVAGDISRDMSVYSNIDKWYFVKN